MGVERHPYPEFGVFPGHDDTADVHCSLSSYLVAPWHGISSCGCCPFPEHPGKCFSLIATAIIIFSILLDLFVTVVNVLLCHCWSVMLIHIFLCLGPFKCMRKTCQKFHQIADGFGDPSWGTS